MVFGLSLFCFGTKLVLHKPCDWFSENSYVACIGCLGCSPDIEKEHVPRQFTICNGAKLPEKVWN